MDVKDIFRLMPFDKAKQLSIDKREKLYNNLVST